MTTITTSKGKFLFVEVPEAASKFKISGTGHLCHKYEHSNAWKVTLTDTVPESCQFICTTQTITEEQAKEMVDSVTMWMEDDPDVETECYSVYGSSQNELQAYEKAIDSFLSLLRAHNLTAPNYAILRIID